MEMSSNVAKNLLLENTCTNCNHVRETILIEKIESFPFMLSYAHTVIELEKSKNNLSWVVTTYIKDNNVYISAEDYNMNAQYHLHLICSFCELTNLLITKSSSCKHFEEINEIK